jgi:peptide subunit release factor 1 (eRF1)
MKHLLVELKSFKKIPNTGLAFFSDSSRCVSIIPPQPIAKNFYRCDGKFHTEDIMSLYESKETYLHVIATSENVRVIKVSGTLIQCLFKMKTDLATDTRRGGQSAHRLERIRKEKKNLWKQKIMEKCEHIECTGIIISGNGNIPKTLCKEMKSNNKITSPILGFQIIDTKYPLQNIIKKADTIINKKDVMKENDIVKKVKELMRVNPDILVFGEEEILSANEDYLLKYILINDESLLNVKTLNCKVVFINFSDFLNDFNGHIGVRYY